jgi:hypothetical protein
VRTECRGVGQSDPGHRKPSTGRLASTLRPPRGSQRHRGANMVPSTRAEAKSAGAKRYMTGDACKRGHIAERSTHNARCLTCEREYRVQASVREARRETDLAYYLATRERSLPQQAEKRKTPEALARRRARRSWRYANDLQFRLERVLRARMSRVLRGAARCDGINELLGCTREFLVTYISMKFQPGMSWDNYGEWHIDHIRPCSSFDLTGEDGQRECFNYTNLQPLWAFDNLSKGCRVIPD